MVTEKIRVSDNSVTSRDAETSATPASVRIRTGGTRQYSFSRACAEAPGAENVREFSCRRDGRVVEGGGLENRCIRKGTGGSNPSLSARLRGRRARRALRRLHRGARRSDLSAGRRRNALLVQRRRVLRPR